MLCLCEPLERATANKYQYKRFRVIKRNERLGWYGHGIKNLPIIVNEHVLRMTLNGHSQRDGTKRRMFSPTSVLVTFDGAFGVILTSSEECGSGNFAIGLLQSSLPSCRINHMKDENIDIYVNS